MGRGKEGEGNEDREGKLGRALEEGEGGGKGEKERGIGKGNGR